jgi:hypothetical protein
MDETFDFFVVIDFGHFREWDGEGSYHNLDDVESRESPGWFDEGDNDDDWDDEMSPCSCSMCNPRSEDGLDSEF